jgi:hypothetical protein
MTENKLVRLCLRELIWTRLVKYMGLKTHDCDLIALIKNYKSCKHSNSCFNILPVFSV